MLSKGEEDSLKSPHISEEDLAKEGEEFGKNALKNFEDEEMDELDSEENNSRSQHYDIFDKQRAVENNFSMIHELTTENVTNILGSADYGVTNFDDLRGDPERPKEPDSESLRVIPSGPSSCNTVDDDSDLSSQPSVPTSNGGGNGSNGPTTFENENRSSSSCSGGNMPIQQPQPVSLPSSQTQIQQPSLQESSVTVVANRGPVLVMPPHSQAAQTQSQSAYQHPNNIPSQHQHQSTIQKGMFDL